MESLRDLIHIFLNQASKRLNKNIVGIEDRAVHSMEKYNWPGNIRELQNIIERAAVLTKDSIIRLENLPVIFSELAISATDESLHENKGAFQNQRERHLNQIEVSLLKRYLQESGGNVSEAARKAQIPRRTFYRLLSRHGLQRIEFRGKSD